MKIADPVHKTLSKP